MTSVYILGEVAVGGFFPLSPNLEIGFLKDRDDAIRLAKEKLFRVVELELRPTPDGKSAEINMKLIL